MRKIKLIFCLFFFLLVNLFSNNIFHLSLLKDLRFESFNKVQIRKESIKPTFSLKEPNMKIPYYYENKEEIMKENLIINISNKLVEEKFLYDIDSIDIPGKYTIDFVCYDEFNSFYSYSFDIEIIDDKNPEIIGNEIIKITTDKILTVNELLSHYKAIDEIDKECEVKILDDEYHKDNNSNKEGIYKITLYAIDKFENYATKDIFVNVVSKESEKVYFISNANLYVREGTILSLEQIVDKMQQQGYLPRNTTYINCYKLEGYDIDENNNLKFFQMRLLLERDNFEYDILNLDIEVVEEQEEMKQEVNNKLPSNKIKGLFSFLKFIFTNIKHLFFITFKT